MNVRDAPAIGQSVEYVKGLVQDEIAAGTPANRIVIGGFSQVGSTANLLIAPGHHPIPQHNYHHTTPQSSDDHHIAVVGSMHFMQAS